MADTGGLNFLAAFMLGTLAILVMAVAIIVFVLAHQRRVIAHQQEMKKKDEEMQREMLRATIGSQEAEQRRIARDLHDDLGPLLSAIKLKVVQLKNSMENAGLDATGVEDSREMIDTTIIQVRGISHRLYPPVLEHHGLADSIDDICNRINGAKLKIEFKAPENYVRLSNEKELAVYRVVMELLNNIIRHSKATKAEIIISQNQQGDLEITVSDNGKGFDVSKLNEKNGLGLKSIQSRISAIEGKIDFQSSPGSTVVRVNVNSNAA